MVWHFLLVHDDYGRRVGEKIGVSADDVRGMAPLKDQVLTDEDERRLRNLGNNGDRIDPKQWRGWTSSVENRRASAQDVLGSYPSKAKRAAE